MRLAALTLLAASALALPTTTKRTTNTDTDVSISSLESAASKLSATLPAAYSQLQTDDAAGRTSPGTLAVLVANIETNIAEALTLFSNLASEDVSTADADMAQSRLGGLEKRQDVSVDGVDGVIGELVPGVSDGFNEVADAVEGLGLPPLPVG